MSVFRVTSGSVLWEGEAYTPDVAILTAIRGMADGDTLGVIIEVVTDGNEGDPTYYGTERFMRAHGLVIETEPS